LAEGIDALVMDVKFGAAAFMPTLEQARQLAQSIVSLAGECGVNTCALLTSMDRPLGRAAGNWLEVVEAVELLENRGPADLRELVLGCAASLLVQTGKENNDAAAKAKAEKCLASGEPLHKWEQLIEAQGGVLRDYHSRLQQKADLAPVVLDLPARVSGYVSAVDARMIGEVVRDLGGGRIAKDTVIHFEVGIDQMVQPGEKIEKGGPLCRIHAKDQGQAKQASLRLAQAFVIVADPPALAPLIAEKLGPVLNARHD
jgi:thymidine phosphorylase